MDDSEFLQAFEAAAIPGERWAHRDHVRMAFLYLRDHSFAQALARIRSGIRALNRANGGRDTPTSGYHETVTVAWARVVAAAIAASGTDPDALRDSAAFIALHPQLLAKDLLRAHYSRNLIMSPEARASFVEPDLTALPAGDSPGDTVESLLLDMLEWIAAQPRPYSEVMAAWRTSCPRLPVWEEAGARSLVERSHEPGGATVVSVTALGREFLKSRRPAPGGVADRG
jgi:hypothetical protein